MQVQALQMPSQAETIDFVSSSLDDLESGRTRPMLNHIAKVWTDGNFAELARFESWCNCVDTATERAAMKRMLDDRNPQLAAAIDSLHSSGTRVFAAVGSLHMIGPRACRRCCASAATGSSRATSPAEPAGKGARGRPGWGDNRRAANEARQGDTRWPTRAASRRWFRASTSCKTW